MEATSPTGDQKYLTSVRENDLISATIQPKEVGKCSVKTVDKVHVYVYSPAA